MVMNHSNQPVGMWRKPAVRMLRPAALLMLIAVLLTACSGKPNAKDDSHAGHGAAGHETGAGAASGDLREKTASAAALPLFLKNQPEEVKLVYQAAGQAADILGSMPCYCGCGDSAGHKSNLNCFIHEVQEGGAIVWDDHGTRCGVCLQIAVKAIKMKQDGKSLQEIRQTIDATYKQGYAKPTPTPLPA